VVDVTGATKLAFALDGLIRARTKGHGGEEYARKCINEIAEGIEELTTPTPTPTAHTSAMKRYLLFAGDTYYPHGGMHDLRGDFFTAEGAVSQAQKGEPMVAVSGYDWWHVIDTETWLVVASHDRDEIGKHAANLA